jgi:para-nitrobenzyl esterase
MSQPFALKRREFLALTSSLALLGPGCAGVMLPSGRTKVVHTSSGPLQGVKEHGVNAFKGVRYAQPPMGELRFKPPVKVKASKDVVDAVAFGAPAVQMYSRPSGEPSSALGKSLFEVFPTGIETRAGSEDCLFLNVWSKGLNDGHRRPIMVWIHGGGMVYGSGAWPAYHGYNLAAKGDVVVVTINHRLNAFGYSYLADAFGEAYADSGNAGTLDLIEALKWVRENAGAFGGDAGNVTLFGQSGGGAKIATLMAAPAAKGLFHKVIVESGAGLRAGSKESASKTADAVLAEIGVAKGDVKALQEAPAEKIRMALFAAQEKGRVSWGSVIDGRTLTRHPFDPDAPEQARNIPMLIGTNKDEAALFSASAPWFGKLTDEELKTSATPIAGAKTDALIAAFKKANPSNTPTFLLTDIMTAQQFWNSTLTEADRKVKQGGAPVYMYRMDWGTPIGGGVYRSGHSVETPLVFDTVEANRALLGPGPEPQAVATQMSSAWLAFAHKGDPNTSVLPAWPKYDLTARSTMIFNVTSHVENDPYAEIRGILQS